MTPTVIETNGSVSVTGLTPQSAHRARFITTSSVDDLITGGHALPVADAVLDDDIDENAVALWLGNRFHELAQKLRLPPAPLPARKFEVPEGRFFIGNPSKMFVYLEQWVARAFERFSKENDAELRTQIASLMQWTLPDHPESLAATWQVASDPERELQRQLQIFGRGTDWISGYEELEDNRFKVKTPLNSFNAFSDFCHETYLTFEATEDVLRLYVRHTLGAVDADSPTLFEDLFKLLKMNNGSFDCSSAYVAIHHSDGIPYASLQSYRTFLMKWPSTEIADQVDLLIGDMWRGMLLILDDLPKQSVQPKEKQNTTSDQQNKDGMVIADHERHSRELPRKGGQIVANVPPSVPQRSNPNLTAFLILVLVCIGLGYFLINPATIQRAPSNSAITSTPEPMGNAYVDRGSINVRAGPGTSYGVSTKLAQGDSVICCIDRKQIQDGGTWVRIRAGDVEGWVNEKLLSKTPSSRHLNEFERPSIAGLNESTRAASFDCTKAIKNAEKLICSDSELSALDGRMAEAYRLVAAASPYKERLKGEQRDWLKNHRNTCATIECLRTVYQVRIKALEGASGQMGVSSGAH